MNKTFALAAALAAGVALAPIAGEAAMVTGVIQGDLGDLGIGDTLFFNKALVSGSATDAWTFDVDEDLLGGTVAINLDLPKPLTISSVMIVRGAGSGVGSNFTWDNSTDVLATGSVGQTITAVLNNADNPFAVIVERSGGPGSYTGIVSAVPVPAALPLMLTALAGLGLIGRRRMQAAA